MQKQNAGSGLLETLIAAALFAIVLIGFISAISSLGISDVRSKLRSEASQAARESLEVAYNLSVQDWDSFSALAGEYHPDFSGTYATLSPGEEVLAEQHILRRSLSISTVVRNSSGQIVASGGVTDPNTIKVTSLVYWGDGAEHERIEFTTYLTNLSELINL